MKKAVVTGITGQDGAYLAQLLLSKGYQVTGAFRCAQVLRRTSGDWAGTGYPQSSATGACLNLSPYSTPVGAIRLLDEAMNPREFYNLAAQSLCRRGRLQHTHPTTAHITGLGPVLHPGGDSRGSNRKIRFYQASTRRKCLGKVQDTIPQSEDHRVLSA